MEFDPVKMLVGDEFSWGFILEIIVRTTIMYLYTLGIVRVIGKRGLGHLSPFELVIIVALGSAVGDPMFYEDIPIIHGITVITVVVFLQRMLQEVTEKSPKLEQILESKPRKLITDGDLDKDALEHENLSRQELFSALRAQEVESLGQVRLAFLEPSGEISVFKFEGESQAKGQSILPD